jgi:hypothetical protein
MKTYHGFFDVDEARKTGFATFLQPNGNIIDTTTVDLEFGDCFGTYVGEILIGSLIKNKIENAKKGIVPIFNGTAVNNYDNKAVVAYWKKTYFWEKGTKNED